jgi:hypothetical protein
VLRSKPYIPGRGRSSTVTICPLSANVAAEKLTRANTMFSGGPCRITMIRGVPAAKLTEVSEGGGPAVSSTMTRASARTRAGAGVPDGVGVAIGCLEPQASAISQVAGVVGLRNIARITTVRGKR